MKPLSRTQAEAFEGTVMHALGELPLDDVGMVIACHEPEDDGATLVAVGGIDDSTALAAIDQLIARRPAALAAGIQLNWAPGESGPDPEPSWVVIVVVPGRMARIAVKRHTEDRWWRLKPPACPWLVLSTAGSLRSALERGEPLVLKAGDDRRLFRPPGQGEPPPTDAQGRI